MAKIIEVVGMINRGTNAVCRLSDCTNTNIVAKKMCSKHYWRNHRYGSPHIVKNEQHGLRKVPEYEIWAAMKDRTTRLGNKSYKDYGGRGIKVCDEWFNSFTAFYRDMGNRPTATYTIERIDNDGNYSPDNCRWATRLEQAQNQRPKTIKGFAKICYRKTRDLYEVSLSMWGDDRPPKYIFSYESREEAKNCANNILEQARG